MNEHTPNETEALARGYGARWCGWDAFRSLRDQCATQGVAFFFKQAAAEPAGPVLSLPALDGVQHAAFPLPFAQMVEV